MNLLKKLFGSSDLVKAGIEGLDAVFFTYEEKAKFRLELMRAYEPFKLAQRLLALTFCIPYALGWLAVFIASFWLNTEQQIALLSGDMALAVGIILSFYFGGGFIEGVLGKAKIDKPTRRL